MPQQAVSILASVLHLNSLWMFLLFTLTMLTKVKRIMLLKLCFFLSRSLVVRGSNESEYTPEGDDADECREFRINAPCADEALDGDGGHILAEGSEANLHLENVELFRMGQTNVNTTDSVFFEFPVELELSRNVLEPK